MPDNTGLSPYVVITQYHRKYINAPNRTEACAFTDAKKPPPFYREYHDCIAGYAGQILGQNGGRGFLFDIHGTQVIAADPADIYLGTANGASLPAGFDRQKPLYAARSTRPAQGARRQLDGGAEPPFQYRVSPADEHTPETGRTVSGGFTIKHYGAIINSIQIKTADTLHADPALRAFFVDDLASALVISRGATHRFSGALRSFAQSPILLIMAGIVCLLDFLWRIQGISI